MTTARSGRRSIDAFAHFDPNTSSWRTSQQSLPLGNSSESRPAWPRSGIASRGVASPLPQWVPRTSGIGSSSSLLLKTPTAQLAVNGGSQHPTKRKAGGHGPTLADEVEHLLPTPTATPYGNNQSPSPGASVRPSLNSLASTLLPTPKVADSRGTRNATAKRNSIKPTTNLGWTLTDVFWTGPGTSQPSVDGKPSSDDPHPFLPFPEPAADES